MNNYTKLFSSIVTSTIWTEDDQTRIVWITMLALADKNGEVHASIPGLARVAAVSVEACDLAIRKFLGPDAHSRSKEDDGRRIEPIDGGWTLLNHAKYRRMASKDEEKEKHARRQARYRERVKRNGVTASVTIGDAPCRLGDARVTQDRDIADADADADAKGKTKRARYAIPENLNTPAFLAAWADWQQHRKEKKRPITSLAEKKQLEQLSEWGVARAVVAINHSIMKCYEGIYEPKNPPQAQSNPTEPPGYDPNWDWKKSL